MGVTNYLQCLVTQEDEAKMDEVDVNCLFTEAQQALNRALVLHRKTFLRYLEELNQHKAETRGLTEKRDAYKLLSEKLQAELEAVRKEHADLVEQVRREIEVSDDESDTVANGPNPQVQKKLDQIKQLQAKVDAVKAEAEEWKRNMDRAQLTSVEVQLRTTKEKVLVQAKKVEGLQSQLSSIVSDQENLAKELEAFKSEVVVVKAEVDERVAEHQADTEAVQELVKNMIEHMKLQSRREALEEVHARGFDLLAKIEDAKVLEAAARKLPYPEESEDSGESEGDGDPEGDDVAPDED
ncbi:uncharacterized protein [Nicotiana tomentosiformis]|uniref:uncharacterized protein n=1 Tax=Nicotiana tomentosiformis TaxID=4098 RepID=UPI00388C7B86